MFKGTVEFRARLSRGSITFPLLHVDTPEPRIKDLTIEGKDDGVIVGCVWLADLASRDDAGIARVEVERILDRLAFSRDLMIQPFEEVSVNLAPDLVENEPEPGFSTSAIQLVTFGEVCSITILHDVAKNDLETELPCQSELSLYRNAMACFEPVARFMFLYSVLSHLFRDDNNSECQRCVDGFLRTRADAHELQERKHPRNAGTETVYSRLRNEVGHARDSVHAFETKNLIERYVDRLARHVHAGIQYKINEFTGTPQTPFKCPEPPRKGK